MKSIDVVGAGLAGSECAYQLAEKGYLVHLWEMRPSCMSPAHKTSDYAELVCSNSFGSQTEYSASGQLKWEAHRMSSLVLALAKEYRVPAGMSLSVDRVKFSQAMTERLLAHKNIIVENAVVKCLEDIPRPCVIATGPLTHPDLAQSLQEHFGGKFLYFYDAIAPIVDAESINWDVAWRADRWGDGDGSGDYINCPMSKEQYYEFIAAIEAAEKAPMKDFEITPYFDGCMPIEAIAERGRDTPRFGPMSSKGLTDPRVGKRSYAVVQLRQENREATAYNMVGFQTKMKYSEQVRVFRMIPGLENADFLKLGSIHRNLYINSPEVLNDFLSSKNDDQLYFAGQITGVEGYFESTCMGLLVAHIIMGRDRGSLSMPPRRSFMGALYNALREPKDLFQPTNINFGLAPPLEEKEHVVLGKRNRLGKRERRDLQLELAKEAFTEWFNSEL